MMVIEDYQRNERFRHHLDVIRANAPVSYGGLKLYEGKRNYLMQSPKEFAATLCFLEDHFKNKEVKYLEIGTASNLTNSMIWNNLNIKENIIIDNLECPNIAESLVGNLSFKQNSVLIVGDSTENNIKQKIDLFGYKYELMLIDGNHDFEYVTKDFEYYYRFLADDGLLMFHDIDNDKVEGVREFIKTNPILKNKFSQCCNFVDSENYIKKETFGSQCGIGIFSLIKN